MLSLVLNRERGVTGGQVGWEDAGPEDVIGGTPEDKVPFPEVVLPIVVEGVGSPTFREVVDVGCASAGDEVAAHPFEGGDDPASGGARWCQVI